MQKVLLVEDDEQLAIGIEYTLKTENFKVIRANSLEQSKKKFNEIDGLDLILLDMTLPDGTGYDFCRYVRERSKTPIIFLTAIDEEVNVVLAFDLGADDYVTKPIRIREFISRIKAVLRRSEKYDDRTVRIKRCGDLILDISKARLYKNGQEVLLTSVEYKILLYFIKNPNVVITRDAISESLWEGGGEYIEANTLTVYIRRIREKIEDYPSEPRYIKTVRGLGYMWDKNVMR